MSIEALIDDSGQQATITAEAPDRQLPGQTAAGGADRSDGNWLTVADGVPCLVWTEGVELDYDRNDQRAAVVEARIYFYCDPVPPPGLTSRNRITVTQQAPDGTRRLVGVYAVTGSREPARGSQRLVIADCQRIRSEAAASPAASGPTTFTPLLGSPPLIA